MPTIDYYDLVETAAITLIRSELASYLDEPTKQVTKSDDTYLDQGYDYFAIAYPGAFPAEWFAVQNITAPWEVIFDIMVRWKDTEPAAWAAFKAWRAEFFYLFNIRRIGRTLNGTPRVENVLFAAEDRPRYIPVEASNPESGIAFIAQACILTVTTKINKVD